VKVGGFCPIAFGYDVRKQTLSAAQFGALSEYGAEIAGPLTKGRVAGGLLPR